MTLNSKILILDSIAIIASFVIAGLNYKKALTGNGSAQILTLIFGVSFVLAIAHLIKAYLNAHQPGPSTKGDVDRAENGIKTHITKTQNEITDHLDKSLDSKKT